MGGIKKVNKSALGLTRDFHDSDRAFILSPPPAPPAAEMEGCMQRRQPRRIKAGQHIESAKTINNVGMGVPASDTYRFFSARARHPRQSLTGMKREPLFAIDGSTRVKPEVGGGGKKKV